HWSGTYTATADGVATCHSYSSTTSCSTFFLRLGATQKVILYSTSSATIVSTHTPVSTTVRRSSLRSAVEAPPMEEDMPPPKRSDIPPPLPLWRSTDAAKSALRMIRMIESVVMGQLRRGTITLVSLPEEKGISTSEGGSAQVPDSHADPTRRVDPGRGWRAPPAADPVGVSGRASAPDCNEPRGPGP